MKRNARGVCATCNGGVVSFFDAAGMSVPCGSCAPPTKRPAGRPAEAGERRTRVIYVRASTEEAERYEAAAEAAGCPLAEWARDAMDAAVALSRRSRP